jgi:hypothetical protein
MKIGDIVKIKDFSYSIKISSNGLERVHDVIYVSAVICSLNWEILAIDCILPSTFPSEQNNVIVRGVDKDNCTAVLFTQERFCVLAKPKIREVTMAEVCRQFGEEVKIRKES